MCNTRMETDCIIYIVIVIKLFKGHCKSRLQYFYQFNYPVFIFKVSS
jgi:hypothetical protein